PEPDRGRGRPAGDGSAGLGRRSKTGLSRGPDARPGCTRRMGKVLKSLVEGSTLETSAWPRRRAIRERGTLRGTDDGQRLQAVDRLPGRARRRAGPPYGRPVAPGALHRGVPPHAVEGLLRGAILGGPVPLGLQHGCAPGVVRVTAVAGVPRRGARPDRRA